MTWRRWACRRRATRSCRRRRAPAPRPRCGRSPPSAACRCGIEATRAPMRVAPASEQRLELQAVSARLVDEAGQVVEVDAADHADLVGDVAHVRRGFVLAL